MKFKFINCIFVLALVSGLFFSTANAQQQPSDEIEVDVMLSNNDITVTPGSRVIVTVNITNNQAHGDSFYLYAPGECPGWIRFTRPVSKYVASGSHTLESFEIIALYTTSMTNCVVDITATNSLRNKWNEETIMINIVTGDQTGKMHYQSDVDVDPQLSIGPTLATSGLSSGHVGVDFVFNPKLQSRGYVLNNNGQVCVGDSLTLAETSVGGEWYQKGGPNDSPPIEFVDDLDAVKAQISAGTYKTKLYHGTICSWGVSAEAVTGPSRCIVDASMICSHKCNVDDSGSVNKLSDNRFEITGEGSVEIKLECPTECIFFVDREEGIYQGPALPTLSRAYGTMTIQSPGTLTSTTVLNAVSGTRGPDLRVTKTTYMSRISQDQPLYARMFVENTGDMEAIIDSVELNLANSEIMYKPKTILPGDNVEILIKADAQDISELKVTFEYRSDKLGCLGKKEFSDTFSLGSVDVIRSTQCRENSECGGLGLTTPVCCLGMCRDAAVGNCDDFDGDGYFEWSYY